MVPLFFVTIYIKGSGDGAGAVGLSRILRLRTSTMFLRSMMVIMFSLSQTVSWDIPSLLSTILSLTALAFSPGAVPPYRTSKPDSPY